ncbi:MAG: hypothetical protein KIT84_03420 [Labilithrix sp.]|nr:hypothetical protein [Labilithrix sp.]MCW5810033.1 hypothetical protein [Labilithrix sp.]
MIRQAPSLVPELARELGIVLPAYAKAKLVDPDASQVTPLERRADAVVALEDANGDVVALLVIEVQLAVDDEKQFTWPLYLASVHARHRCRALLVVVTPFEAVAEWAARASATFQPPSAFRPIVLGPAEIPRIDDAEAAIASPELALLSAFVHGPKPDGDPVVRAAFQGVRSLESPLAGMYADLALVVLGEVARPFMEAVMAYPPGYQPMSDWAKKHYGEGLEKGLAQGSIGAARRAVLIAAEARGLELSATARARVEACADVATLEEWLRRVASATSESDVWPAD